MRKIIDCRWYPTTPPCTLSISGEEEEVVRVAVLHSVDSHGYTDSPELRQELRGRLRDEPSAEPEAHPVM